jgi:PTS system ascorbate-specific IIA component
MLHCAMASILVVAHAPLASSLHAVAQHVYPDCSRQLSSLDVDPGAAPEEVETRVRTALQALGAAEGAEVLVLVDVFGATPCNAALAAADGTRARVVAGVNVPMLWRTLCYSALSLDDLVARAVVGATQGVMHVAVPRRQNQANSLPNDDQVKHHHQQ